ncbi:unnamed protein product [Ophioblennius macclurei]
MSHRSRRASSSLGHAHCDSCFSRRCRRRVDASESCALATCRLHCGALFHLCKEEEHLQLCPNVRVPCINAQHGCPLQLPRSSRAAHLQNCPASVVCCSMEWNRWPANDAHSHLNTELHENLLRERRRGGCLDLAMALKDQDRLFHSLKMKKLFPELIQTVEQEEEEEREEERMEEMRRKEKEKQRKAQLEKEAAVRDAGGHTWESFSSFNIQVPELKDDNSDDDDPVELDLELSQEEREALARAGVDANLLENYNAWERMFSMEMGGCREAGDSAAAGRGRGRGRGRGQGQGLGAIVEEESTCMGAAAAASGPCRSASGPSASCMANDFVYGCVEPMKITTVRTFKIPTSFAARQGRIRNPGFYRRESKAVDTSDLGVPASEMPVWEEVQASLLCSLERELRGHLIAESVCSDALLQDEGTQTYSFLSAPFRRKTSLADLTTGKRPELHLQLQVESVTSRHHKASSAFTFLCGHTFQRREYCTHYKNVHEDIQMGVNGWFEQRCPLAYLGCTFSQKRFRPSTHDADVNYNEDLGFFSLHPTIHGSLEEAQGSRGGGEGGDAEEEDSLSSLPYEVLCHMASFLDSLSLSQLALVSRLMRQVCWSLLQERGMVTLVWEKKTSSQGRATWSVKQKVWQFSTLFSPVDTWSFKDAPSISEHLKTCPHYERESKTEKVRLPRVQEEIQTSKSCKGPTLVSTFQQKRIMM